MLQKIKALITRGPSRADLEEMIAVGNDTIERLAQANHALITHAHFQDKQGRMLPKGKLPKHLGSLLWISTPQGDA